MRNTAALASQRFSEYVDRLGRAVGHEDRRKPLRFYLTGLCLPGERKSVEPIAARVDPRHVRAQHQSLHHFVASSPWDEEAVLRVSREWALTVMERHGAVAGWIVDDTGMPKKGRHSVGVARQYCGVLGKQDNCQVAVTLTLANEAISIPVAYRLYLPESWSGDTARRQAAGIPDDIGFLRKWEIALDQIAALRHDGLPPAPVLADAGYGAITSFRDRLTESGIPYAVGVTAETTVWPPGQEPLPPRRWSGRGRPPTRKRRGEGHGPSSILAVASALPKRAWRVVEWRQGTRGAMRSRFACLRVRAAHRDEKRPASRPEEWLLIEWPRDEKEPTKYWLSTLPEDTPVEQLVRLAKLRWRIERDYQELKDEIGLDHYEGRNWRGFHHHGALCIAAYSFLAAERARLSPPEPLSFLRPARLPRGFRPRGASRTSGAPRAIVNPDRTAIPATSPTP